MRVRAALLALGLIAAAPAAADQIFTNANGYTLGPDGELKRFASLVLGKDGRVKALLPAGAPLPRGTRRDVGGRTLMPGLIDAHARLSSVADPADRRARERGWAAAMAAANASGLTMIHDAGTTADSWAWLKRQNARRRLTLRVHAMADGPQQLSAIAGETPVAWDGKAMLAARAMTLRIDGPVADRQAWLKADYADRKGERGRPLIEEGRLRRQVLAASAQGFQIDLEAHGDAAIGAALAALAAVPDGQRAALRHRIAGLRLVGADELPRFARLNVVAVASPLPPASGESEGLGSRRAAGLAGWASLSGGGARVAGDAGPDPLAAMQAAASAQQAPLAGLAMYTQAAAHAAHAEMQHGMLVPGHWGDFILLDGDPLAGGKPQVMETWLAGRRVYRRP